MSSDPRDRVLEHALRRVLREGEEVDLTARIVQAWERGVPGSADLDELDLEAGGAGPPAPRASSYGRPGRNGSARRAAPVRRPWLVLSLAAAAAVVLLLLSIWKWGRPASEGPFAVASAAIELLSGEDRSVRFDTLIRPGDTLLVESRSVDIEVGGAVLRAGPETVLVAHAVEEGLAFDLELGTVELSGAEVPFRLAAPFATLRALPGADLEVRVELDAWPAGFADLGFRDRSLALLAPGFSGERSLRLDVTAGEAQLEHDGALTAVGPRTTAGPVVLAEQDVDRLDSLFESLFLLEARLYEAKGMPERLAEVDGLGALLARSLPLWSRLERKIETMPRQYLANVIDFLGLDPSERAQELASTLWLDAPEAFSDVHMVAFAERGAFEFRREIPAQVEMYAPGLGREEAPVVAAAYLALRGDDAGRELLREASSNGLQVGWAPLAYLAAFALDRLGDEDAWFAVERRVQEEVGKLLDEGELIAASDVLLRYEYFHELRESPGTPLLGTFQTDVYRWTAGRRNEVQTEDEILALMRRLFG